MSELINIEEMLQTLEQQDRAITELKSELSKNRDLINTYKDQIQHLQEEKLNQSEMIQMLSSEKSKLKSKVQELADKVVRVNKADLILKENEKLREDNDQLQYEIIATRKEVDKKMKQLNNEFDVLHNNQNRLRVKEEKLKSLIDGKVEAETIEAAKQLKETYEKRWKGRQHYLKGLLIYGIFVTVLEAMRSKVFVRDVVIFFKMFIDAVWMLIKNDFELATLVAKVSESISNNTVEGIVHWIIIGVVCGLSVVVIGFGCKVAGEKVMNYYKENPIDYITTTAAMMSVAILIFLGEQIKRIVPINLTLLLIVIQLMIEMVRSYVKGWKRARGRY